MYTEEELLEAIDILIEEYGYDEEEAIDMINEEMNRIDPKIQRQWDNAKDDKERESIVNSNRGKALASTAIGVGLTAYGLKKSLDRRKAKKELKEKHRKQMEHIAKTGKRMNEEVNITDNIGFTPYKGEHKQYKSYAAGALKGAAVAAGIGLTKQYLSGKMAERRLNKLDKKYKNIENKAIEAHKNNKKRNK